MNRSIHVFPGAHKTGTTLLQAGLEKHRATLEARGMGIAQRRIFYRSGMHAALTRKGDAAAPSRAERTAMFDAVFGPGWQERDLVISVENMFGEAGPRFYGAAGRAMERLTDWFPDHDPSVTYYIRRQDTFLESLFVQKVHRAEIDPIEAFLPSVAEIEVDWLAILAQVERVVGPDRLTVVPYETIGNGAQDYLRRFFERFLDPAEAARLAQVEDLGDTNVSLSRKGIDIARAAFGVLEKLGERRRLVAVLQREFGVDRYPRFRFPKALRAAVADRHRAINARLVAEVALEDGLDDHYAFRDVAGGAAPPKAAGGTRDRSATRSLR